uniref:Secreted protein n=1 Tax=Steinernema glaseri TaxID=37863 RepID=A0A1I7YR36_9BILA
MIRLQSICALSIAATTDRSSDLSTRGVALDGVDTIRHDGNPVDLIRQSRDIYANVVRQEAQLAQDRCEGSEKLDPSDNCTMMDRILFFN